MPESKDIPHLREAFRNSPYQGLAITFCVLFAIAMIVNTQLSGEGFWFWYATFFRNGSHLYANMHLPLQPVQVLEYAAWMKLFGVKCLSTETPSLLHAIAICFALFLILRESRWPDWQKAIVLAGGFLICIVTNAYRFDDFHCITDIFILYSEVALLWIAHATTDRQRVRLSIWLGILGGFAITTRLNDGAALLLATGIALAFLVPGRRLLVLAIYFLALALTWALIVKLTGDTFHAYVSNSIFAAAATKGVTKTNILSRPFTVLIGALSELRTGGKRILTVFLVMVAAAAAIARYRPKAIRYIVPIQLAIAAACSLLFSPTPHFGFVAQALVHLLTVVVIVVSYLLVPAVVAHYVMSLTRWGTIPWDAREVLILLPLGQLASASVSSAGEASIFTMPIAMLLLLIPLLLPFRRSGVWANPSMVTLMAIIAVSCVATKFQTPYSWNHFRGGAMFVNRQWYRHPVYGPLYIERDVLHLYQPICDEIHRGSVNPDLLSIPFSNTNYFCAIAPWHGYVQTYFDTSSAATIHYLMDELNTAPPQ